MPIWIGTSTTNCTNSTGLYSTAFAVSQTASATTCTDSIWLTQTSHTGGLLGTYGLGRQQREALIRMQQNADADRWLDEHPRRVHTLAGHTEKAKKRATKLLLEHLTPVQRKTFRENGWFVVEGGQSKRRYKIREQNDMVANIDVLGHDDRVEHRLCGHCRISEVPVADQLLAQAMWLQHDEQGFLRVANRH